jgi:hypothetical protein
MTAAAQKITAIDTEPIPSADDEVWFTRCPVPTPFAIALQTGAISRALSGAGLSWRALQESSDPDTHGSHFTHR